LILEESFSFVGDRMSISFENASHQDLTFDQVRVAFDEDLTHNSTKGVSSDENIVTCKSSLFKLLDCLSDIMVNKDRFWRVKHKFWSTDPSFVTSLTCNILELLSNGLVSLRLAAHSVDPDDCEWLAFRSAGRRIKNDLFS